METAISSVVVYPDRARIVRQGTQNVKPGIEQIEIPGLSIHLDTDSARVKARGTARARLLGLHLHREFYTETPADYVRDLEAQVQAVQEEIERLDVQVEIVRGHRTRLDDLAGHTKTYAKALSRGAMNIDTQLAYFERLRASTEKLEEEVQSLVRNRRTLERRRDKLQGQLDQFSSARSPQRYSATVEFEVSQPGDLTIELTYDVSKAGWVPLYDFRLLEEGGKPRVEVGYLAQVSQNTGENWNGVALTLSTARPQLAGMSPELEPWYVRPYEAPVPRMVRGPEYRMLADVAPAGEAAAAEMDARPPTEVDLDVESALAAVTESGTAIAFEVPGKVVVPADGEPHKVSVARYWLPPELDYVSAPKIVQAAYVRAKLVNDSPHTLLPGSTNLFSGEEFIGQTGIQLTPPGAEMELFFGVDDRLKVSRELVRRDVDKALIGGKRRIHYAYQVRVNNYTTRMVNYTLSDQFPVSRHEDIKVKLERVEPVPDEKSELNLLTWAGELDIGAEAQIRFDFVVEHPAEMNISGLP